MDNSAPVLKTKIIPAYYDRFWAEPIETIQALSSRKVLVLAVEPINGDMLPKMLTACKLSPDDYCIIPVSRGNIPAWHQLQHKLHPRFILLLGVMPAEMGLSVLFVYAAPNRFGSAIWIPGPSVTEMEQKQELKKKLWEGALSPVFIGGKFGM